MSFSVSRENTNFVPSTLLLVAGTAPRELLLCFFCNRVADQWLVPSNEFTWSLKLKCTPCLLDWYVCTQCPSSFRSSRYKNRGAVLRHERKFHLESAPSQAPDTSFPVSELDHGGSSSTSSATLLDSLHDQESSATSGGTASSALSLPIAQAKLTDFWNALTLSSKFPNFGINISGEASQEYFKYESRRDGLGAIALVCKSQFGYLNPDQSFSSDDIWLQLAIADILFELTAKQRIKLTSVFDGIIKYQDRLRKENNKPLPVLRIPTSILDVRQMILEGKNAIVPNLPHPQLEKLPNGHSYMSLRSAIADLLAHGAEIDIDGYVNPARGQPVQQLGQAPQFQKLYENARTLYSTPVLALWGVEWSDDFEPNTQAKQNRGSAWVKTVTIATPHARIHSTDNTYVIALGEKGTSHEEVEKLFADKLKSLIGKSNANMFYCEK